MSNKAKVVGFQKGFTNTTHMPWVLAILDCKHFVQVEFTITDPWGFEHNNAYYATKIGDERVCIRCAEFAKKLAQLRELDRDTLSHARFRPTDSRGGSEGSYYVYVRDPKSPSQVRLLLSIEANETSQLALEQLRLPALSPTEKR